MTIRKRRVFISFDFDSDRILYDFMIRQARQWDSPFEVEDWSLKEAAPKARWVTEAREKIKRSDSMLVIVGRNTYRAPGVLKEVEIANELRKHVFQVIGYRDSSPRRVPGAGRIYKWNWPNLEELLAPVVVSSRTYPLRTRRLRTRRFGR